MTEESDALKSLTQRISPSIYLESFDDRFSNRTAKISFTDKDGNPDFSFTITQHRENTETGFRVEDQILGQKTKSILEIRLFRFGSCLLFKHKSKKDPFSELAKILECIDSPACYLARLTFENPDNYKDFDAMIGWQRIMQIFRSQPPASLESAFLNEPNTIPTSDYFWASIVGKHSSDLTFVDRETLLQYANDFSNRNTPLTLSGRVSLGPIESLVVFEVEKYVRDPGLELLCVAKSDSKFHPFVKKGGRYKLQPENVVEIL